MHRIIRIKAYEAEHGPHFNDEHARKAVNKMENEDGTRGQHWSLEETTALANQSQQFPLPNQNRKKLVDITIGCDGEQKKLSVEENKSIVTDGAVGLTIATDKQQIITMVKNNYNEYKAKKEALAKYEEEMNKCDAILKQLDYQEENLKQEDPRIKELQEQVAELKGLIKQAGNMVPPQMKQMLPQNMQKAMNEAS